MSQDIESTRHNTEQDSEINLNKDISKQEKDVLYPEDRNLFIEDRDKLYKSEEKTYNALNNIKNIYVGAVQLGLTKLASRLKDAKTEEEIMTIIGEIRELTDASELKNIISASSLTLKNMKSIYSTDTPVIISTKGGLLEKLFGGI